MTRISPRRSSISYTMIVRPFEQLVRTRISSEPPHTGKLGAGQPFHLFEYAVDQARSSGWIVFRNPGKDALEIIQGLFVEHHPQYTKMIEPLPCVGERYQFRISVGSPAAYFRELLIAEPTGARVLRFHFDQNTRRLFPPGLRPCANTFKYLADLIFYHAGSIPYWRNRPFSSSSIP
jgi:hypothetical protein